MTREEQIEKEAIDYSEIEDNFMEYDDCGDVCDDKDFIEKAFIQGTKWADEHPKEELHKEHVKKILKILNDYYQIGDGGPIWLETEKDYENVANNIIELEKLYLKIN